MALIPSLGAEKAFIFRIVHRDNLPWILNHGLHCRSAQLVDPGYVDIGNPELISKRNTRQVPIPPGGTLSDYVPFYFTPRSPMLLNIKTGYNGIKQRPNNEIMILVSSLRKIDNMGISFIFTDQHAYVQSAKYYDDLARLDRIDWGIIQRSDFKRDLDDLGKFERYQAEALVHDSLPVSGLVGIACDSQQGADRTAAQLKAAGLDLQVISKPGWYF